MTMTRRSFALLAATAGAAAVGGALAPGAHAATGRRRVVLTGFAPFAGRSLNTSWDVASRIASALAADPSVEVVPVRLPVDFTGIPERLLALQQQYSPDLVYCLGEAADRNPYVRMEMVGTNATSTGAPVLAGGAYELRAPAGNLTAARAGGTGSAQMAPSYYAGTYVCNATLYHGLTLLQRAQLRRFAFTHVPALPSATSPQVATFATTVTNVTRALLAQP